MGVLQFLDKCNYREFAESCTIGFGEEMYDGFYRLDVGSPGEIRTPVNGSKARYDSPLHYRASIYLQ